MDRGFFFLVDDTGLEKGILHFTIFIHSMKAMIFLTFLRFYFHILQSLIISFHQNNDQITTKNQALNFTGSILASASLARACAVSKVCA